jgi:hypothetical protein
MNRKQIIIAWAMTVMVCVSVVKMFQLTDFYARGYRFQDGKGNIVRFKRVGKKDIWNDLLKTQSITVLPALALGGLLIYALRDKRKIK